MKFDEACGTRYLALLRKRGIEVRLMRKDGTLVFSDPVFME